MKNYILFLPIYLHSSIFYLLLLTLISTLFSWIYHRLQKRQINLITKKGVKIKGKVISCISKRFHSYVFFSYSYGNKQYIQKQSIYPASARDLPEETVVTLYYLSSNPKKAILADFDTYLASVYFMAVGLVFLLLFFSLTIALFIIALFV